MDAYNRTRERKRKGERQKIFRFSCETLLSFFRFFFRRFREAFPEALRRLKRLPKFKASYGKIPPTPQPPPSGGGVNNGLGIGRPNERWINGLAPPSG
jgi:hypothetical protein